MGLSIGLFAIFALFGSLDYATVFSISPFVNETAITIIALLLLSGAMAKSAQIPLHSWLPGSMEGKLRKIKLFLFIIIISFYIYNFLYSNLDYNINLYYSTIPPSLLSIPKETLHIITGNMLGDGAIQYKKVLKFGKVIGSAKFSMTMDTYSLNYLNHLYQTVYSQFILSGLRPYPNVNLPQYLDKTITQYSFNTRSLPLFTSLHNIWYTWNEDLNKFIKIVPSNISEMFSSVSLAYWIMDDGYFDGYGRTKTILLCTESFSKTECILLQSLLSDLGIKTTLKIRNKDKDLYRIRFSKTSVPLVRDLVTPYMHKDFLYKLGY